MALEVLVVDDEADIRELVAGVLEDEGYTVRTAADSPSTEAGPDPSSPRSGSPHAKTTTRVIRYHPCGQPPPGAPLSHPPRHPSGGAGDRARGNGSSTRCTGHSIG